MRRIFINAGIATALLTVASCAHQQYRLTAVSGTRVLIDSTYDTPKNEYDSFLAPYKVVVDSLMGPVVGHSAINMDVKRPESTLSNLLSDILVWGSKSVFKISPDFAIYNMGGIRASLLKGDVTIGDILEIAPFENKLCVVTLKGDKVTELFEQIAARGGEGVSHGVELAITHDRKLKSVKINGKAIDPNTEYRVATLDYLAHGNDDMTAFKDHTDIKTLDIESNNVRFIIEKYFQAMAAQGKEVTSNIEGRITVE